MGSLDESKLVDFFFFALRKTYFSAYMYTIHENIWNVLGVSLVDTESLV